MGKLVKKVAVGAAIIGLAVATGGISLAPSAGLLGVSVATTALGSLALSAGAGLILGGVTGALAKKPHISTAATDRLTANLVLDAPRKFVFGETALATDIRYQEWNGPDQDLVDQVIVLASHGIASVDEIWFEDKLAWTSAGGAQGEFAGYFWCDVILEAGSGGGFTIEQGRWTAANAALRGCAQAHFRFRLTGLTKKATSPFSSSVPSRVTIRGKAARLYDPRQDSSVGGSGPMRIADQDTWAFTAGGQDIGRNLPLQLLAYLIGWRINGKLAVGCGVPADRLDLDSFMTAANLAWEPVFKADGSTEPRYAGDGMFSEADDPKQVIVTFEASMSGKLRDRNGRLSLQLFHNDLATPVIDFTEHDVLGEFTWSPGESLEAKNNVVRGRYTDPSNSSLYQLVDFPAVKLPSLDGIDRTEPVDFALVQSPSQAQRLAKQRLQRMQYPGTFSASFNAKGWAVQDGDVVRLRFPALGFDNKLFRVDAGVVDPTGIVPLSLIEEHASIYAWDADERPAVQGAEPGVYDPVLVPIVQAIEQAGTTAIWNAVTGDGKPDDNADVTGEHTAANTLYVGPAPPEEVAAAVAQVSTLTGTGPGSISYEIEGVRADLEADLAAGNAVQDAALEVVRARIRKGSPNLLPGGDFYDGLNGWTVVGPGWSVATGFSTGPFVQTEGAAGTYLYRDVPAQQFVSYSLSAEMDPDVLGAIEVYADFHNSAGTAIAGAGSIIGDNWVRVSTPPAVAPAGTAFARVYVRSNTTSVFSRATRIQFQEGPASDFDPWVNLSETAASITESKEAIAGLSGAFAAYQVTVGARFDANEGTVDDLTEVVANNDIAATQKITRLNSYVRAAPNMLRNSDFKAGLTSWSVGGGDWGAAATTAAGSFAVLNPSGAGSVIYQDVDLGGDTDVSFSFEASVGLSVNVQFRNSGGVLDETVAYAGTGARVASAVHRSPVGTTSARLTVFNPANSTTYPSVTRVMLQPGPPSAWNDSADVRELRAEATIAAATLASLDGRTLSYIQLTALAGTSNAAITIAAADGPMPYARIVFQGDQFLFDGDVIISGTLKVDGFYRIDLSKMGRDVDSAPFRVFGVGSSGTHPSFAIDLGPCDCTEASAVELVIHQASVDVYPTGGEPVYDTSMALRVTYPSGAYEEKQIGNFTERFMKFVIPAGQGIGTVSVRALVYNGNTNFTDGAGTPADPYVLHKSVDGAITYLDVDATWRFIG